MTESDLMYLSGPVPKGDRMYLVLVDGKGSERKRIYVEVDADDVQEISRYCRTFEVNNDFAQSLQEAIGNGQ